uniref:LigA n=1 Tax=Parastrongyloides trichosuri TaxID=131310 RepID=A0A0N4ZZC8_PARTI
MLRLPVESVLGHGLARGLTFQHLEAAGGDHQGARGLVQPVVGAADALDQTAGPLGRGQLDHQIDVAPVDAQVQRRGADHGLQVAARHRRLDLAPLLGGQRAVVQGDGQVVLIDRPQRLEHELGLPAGVDEDQAEPCLPDGVVNLGDGVDAGVARPGHAAFADQHIHHRRRAGIAQDDANPFSPCGRRWARRARMRGFSVVGWGDFGNVARPLIRQASPATFSHKGRRREPCGDLLRIVHRRAQGHPPHPRRERLQPRQPQRQQVAALAAPDGVDLVQHHAFQVGEIVPRPFPGAEQGQLLRRGQQDVGREVALALFLRLLGVAGAALNVDVQPDLPDGRHQVALDVGGQRLQRREVEGVNARTRPCLGPRPPLGQVDQAGQEARQSLAPARRRHQQGVLSGLPRRDHFQLMPTRRPAPTGEPVGEQGRKRCSDRRRHAKPIACSRSVSSPSTLSSKSDRRIRRDQHRVVPDVRPAARAGHAAGGRGRVRRSGRKEDRTRRRRGPVHRRRRHCRPRRADGAASGSGAAAALERDAGCAGAVRLRAPRPVLRPVGDRAGAGPWPRGAEGGRGPGRRPARRRRRPVGRTGRARLSGAGGSLHAGPDAGAGGLGLGAARASGPARRAVARASAARLGPRRLGSPAGVGGRGAARRGRVGPRRFRERSHSSGQAASGLGSGRDAARPIRLCGRGRLRLLAPQ